MTDMRAAPRQKSGLGFAKRIYIARLLGLSTLSVAIAPALAQRHAPGWVYGLLAIFGLLWAHLAYQLAARSPAPAKAEFRNLKLDSVFCGFWAMAMAANPAPTLLMVMLLLADNALVGGLSLIAASLAGLAAGAALGGLLLGWRLTLSSDLAVQLACLPFLLAYPPAVGVLTYRHIIRVQREKSRFEALNQLDALSGLYSRAHWELRLAEVFERCQRQKQHAMLLLLDIDHFKQVNDNFGHLLGDEAIRFLGGVLGRELRPGDHAGRIGGDEFAILLPDCSNAEATAVIERLQQALETHVFAPSGPRFTLTVSFGLAGYGPDLASPRDWIHRADEALYRAKRAGRNQVCTLHAASKTADPAW
jgi:diguanylate cyclase